MTPIRLPRRTVLKTLAALAAAAAPGAVRANDGLDLGPPEPFDFDRLTEEARARAAATYRPAVSPAPDLLDQVDFDAHWLIRYREGLTLRPAGGEAPVQLFHPGRFFQIPVRIHVVAGGEARQVLFRQRYFTMPADSPARGLPEGTGFSGFRVMRPGDAGVGPDWASFLGASYYRADGPDGQYGLSARGIAVDTGLGRPEEFPHFTAFWLAAPDDPLDDLAAYALLDGPSLAGAYRFGLRRGGRGEGHRVHVTARLFMRRAIERLGVAPLTSMYWYSERDRLIADDWRPEVHDSDGLALATGSGERIWRPLDNPTRVVTSSYYDRDPKGFGLIQRDRRFQNYQDDGARYHIRPSAWVEPLGPWGAGAVQLVQIPTDDETFDNVVAYWTPERPPNAGDALSYEYAVHWVERDPPPATVAAVVATRQGQGGTPGQPIPQGVDKLVIDFEGGQLASYESVDAVEPVVEIRGGEQVREIGAWRVRGTDRWRLAFDFTQTGPEPAEIRAYLRADGRALTETWLGVARTDRNER